MKRIGRSAVFLGCAGCEGAQSALTGAGPESARVVLLTLIMSFGGAIVLAIVCVLLFMAVFGPATLRRKIARERIVWISGVAFPAVILTALLFYGFGVVGAGSAMQKAGEPLRIAIVGERWWWRIRYETAAGEFVETANELRLPVGRVVELELTSPNVIHSFWLPSYAGKLDMVPGRVNRLRLIADAPGETRGQCAEYCGGAHALMAFHAQASPAAEFESWLERESQPAKQSADAGADLFLAAGCGGCHSVRGTGAGGVIGPDLTHVASRRFLGAGALRNNEQALRRWIEDHDAIKPDNLMPAFDFLGDDDIEALARYLASLE